MVSQRHEEFSCLVTVCDKDGKKTIKVHDRGGMDAFIAAFGDGEDLDLTLSRPSGEAAKTRKQEAGFHAMISRWAKDEGHAIEDLKVDLLREIFGLREHVDPLSGQVVQLLREPHTSKLTKAQYSELIERTMEIAARCGYELVAPDEYRVHKEAERRRAARQALRRPA